MKVVIAIDSFKGSLTTFQAGNAIRDGILRVYPDADIFVSPIADGGEGTVEALTHLGGKKIKKEVCGPLGNKVVAEYGIMQDGKTAVIEMSAAAGITLVPEAMRNPMHTTTFGVGELILDAISFGCRKFIVGIGGSATNDCGVGMLQALGFNFLDSNDAAVPFGAEGVEKICSIHTERVNPELKECEFCVACDVKNPLCGVNGCSAVYGPQKGTDSEMAKKMDVWLSDFGKLTQKYFPQADPTYPGAGAAGGMGFAFMAYLNGKLMPGIELVMKNTNLENVIKGCDIVITGEGKLDVQSCMGKAPIGVARLAKKYNKPVVAFSGIVTSEATACNKHGIDAFFPIIRTVSTAEEAMDVKNATKNASDTAEQAFRLIKTFAETEL